jgi:hypothetical protein
VLRLLQQFLVAAAAIGLFAWFQYLWPEPTDAAYNAGRRAWTGTAAGTFEGNPEAGDAVAEGDDHIRQLKQEIRHRLEAEHDFGTAEGGADDGRHWEGTARIFWQSGAPTANLHADDDGVTTFDAGDEGRMWRDSATGYLECYDGSNFQQCLEGIDTDIHVDGTVELLLDGNASHNIELHNHSSRHTDVTTGSSVQGNAFDYIPGTMVGFHKDNDYEALNTQLDCTTPGVYATISPSLNFSTRRGTSTVLLFAYAEVDVNATNSDDNTFQLQHQSNAGGWNQVGEDMIIANEIAGYHSTSIIAVQTGVPALDNQEWRVACTAGLPTSSNRYMIRSYIFLIDLGIDA